MNLMVTGGAGYVGSHVVKQLVENNYKVIVYDNLSQGHLDAIHKDAIFVNADLKDKLKIIYALKKYKINAVLHLAAFVSVGESMASPKKYFENNVGNSLALLDAMKKAQTKFIVFSSTSVLYDAREKMPLTEKSKINPANPYAETKLIFENILKKAESSGIKSISLRYFNAAGADSSGIIGEDHKPETHLIPNALKSASGNKKYFWLYGNDYKTKDGTAVRDYIHVSDLADAHILALESLFNDCRTNVYNLGNEKGYSVLEIIKTAERVTGKAITIKIKGRRAGDMPIAVSDSTKAKKELKWKPKFNNIKTIIETAWNWHKNNPDGYGR